MKRGEVHEAMVGGRKLVTVIVGQVAANPQGLAGAGKVRVRDLHGNAIEFDVDASAIGKRLRLCDLAKQFHELGWNAEDTADYLSEYGVKCQKSTLATYFSNLENHGFSHPCTPRKSSKGELKPPSESFNKLLRLNELVRTCGGFAEAIRCMNDIEQCGGADAVRHMLTTLNC